MDDKNEILFSLSIADFESVIGRELTDDEKDIIMSKFSISWAEDIDCFFSVFGILKRQTINDSH